MGPRGTPLVPIDRQHNPDWGADHWCHAPCKTPPLPSQSAGWGTPAKTRAVLCASNDAKRTPTAGALPKSTHETPPPTRLHPPAPSLRSAPPPALVACVPPLPCPCTLPQTHPHSLPCTPCTPCTPLSLGVSALDLSGPCRHPPFLLLTVEVAEDVAHLRASATGSCCGWRVRSSCSGWLGTSRRVPGRALHSHPMPTQTPRWPNPYHIHIHPLSSSHVHHACLHRTLLLTILLNQWRLNPHRSRLASRAYHVKVGDTGLGRRPARASPVSCQKRNDIQRPNTAGRGRALMRGFRNTACFCTALHPSCPPLEPAPHATLYHPHHPVPLTHAAPHTPLHPSRTPHHSPSHTTLTDPRQEEEHRQRDAVDLVELGALHPRVLHTTDYTIAVGCLGAWCR